MCVCVRVCLYPCLFACVYCIYTCLYECVNSVFFRPLRVDVSMLGLCVSVCVCVGAERNSRERERGSTLAVPEQQRPVQHRSRSVSPHREDSCRARSRPAHVPMQRSALPGELSVECVMSVVRIRQYIYNLSFASMSHTSHRLLLLHLLDIHALRTCGLDFTTDQIQSC